MLKNKKGTNESFWIIVATIIIIIVAVAVILWWSGAFGDIGSGVGEQSTSWITKLRELKIGGE